MKIVPPDEHRVLRVSTTGAGPPGILVGRAQRGGVQSLNCHCKKKSRLQGSRDPCKSLTGVARPLQQV